MLTLDVLICTYNEGVLGLEQMLLPPMEGVRYVVSWQQCHYTAAVPDWLIRDDVTVSILKGQGLSRNRNNALAHSTADLCLIADDDLRYRPEYFSTITSAYEADPALDFATFEYTSPHEHKAYPSHSFQLSKMPKGYYVSSVEITFRRKAVAGNISFNELLGLGAPVLHCGEESIFVADALRSGLNCRFFPKVVTELTKPGTSTTRLSDPGVVMAYGAELWYIHRDASVLPRCILKAWRISRQAHAPGFLKSLRQILAGVKYLKKGSAIA